MPLSSIMSDQPTDETATLPEILRILKAVQEDVREVKTDLNTWKEETKAKFEAINQRVDDIEEEQKSTKEKLEDFMEKQKKKSVLNEMYSKRLNILIHGIDDPNT